MTLSHGALEFRLPKNQQSFCDVITAVLSKLKLPRGLVHIKLFVQVTQLVERGVQAVSMRSSERGEMLSSSVIDDVRLALRANN